MMKRIRILSIGLLTTLLLFLLSGMARAEGNAAAPAGTTFTYQGQLKNDGAPYTGVCDFQFGLWDALTVGIQIGATQTAGSVVVAEGYFTVQLDFGEGMFNGEARWLEIAVRCPAGSGSYTPLAPRQALTPAPYALALPGLRVEQNASGPNVIGGDSANMVTSGVYGSTLFGGGLVNGSSYPNRITDHYGVVSGGVDNQAGNGVDPVDDARYATVGGGVSNAASGEYASVAGGTINLASGSGATVSGGVINQATADRSSVGGGTNNLASGEWSIVGGGGFNTASGTSSAVGGGATNTVSGQYSTIAGGQNNTVSADYSVIGGGGQADPIYGNRVTDHYGTVGGGAGNQAGDNAGTPEDAAIATVGGGWANTASGYVSTIGGGWVNQTSGAYSAVCGGMTNAVSGQYSSIGGGVNNTVSADYSVIGGGGYEYAIYGNRVTDRHGTVGGGYGNQAGNNNEWPNDVVGATVGGGAENIASESLSTVGGGNENIASGNSSVVGGGDRNTASATYSTVSGGAGNAANDTYSTTSGGVYNTADGSASTVSGGMENIAFGAYSTVPGGKNNRAGNDYSFAAGFRAKANHDGAFVWADSSDFDFSSTASNSMNLRATGGFRLVAAVDGSGNPTWTCSFTNGNSWGCTSDRNQKENFTAVDSQAILDRLSQLPLATWNAKGTDPNIKHLGPTAQDFYAAFGLGNSDISISTIDLDGVALSAIQGLYQQNQELQAENASLKTKMDDIQARLAALENGSSPRPGHSGMLPIMPWAGLGFVAAGMVYWNWKKGRKA